MYVCLCRGITEGRVKQLGKDGVACPKALAKALGIDEPGCCGRCLKKIDSLVAMAETHLVMPTSLAP